MRKIVYVVITLAVLSFMIIFIGLQYRKAQVKKVENYTWDVTDRIVSELDDLTLIRQLFMFYFKLDDMNTLQNLMPGGIFIHTKNIPVFSDLRENLPLLDSSIDKINNIYRQQNIPLPWYSIDQEGGRVRRIKNYTTDFPSNMTLGEAYRSTQRDDLPLLAGFYTCMELRQHGIQWPLTPVVDVQVNPDNPVIGVRSFGSDPKLVSKMAGLYVKGLQNARCMSAIKHFPGHGDTNLDSHRDLPVINKSLEELNSIELYPYKKLTQSDNPPHALMSAHIVFNSVSIQPATLSSAWLTDKLRKEMHYEGIIITDDLAMNAMNIYQKQENIKNLAVNAFLAGADVLLYSFKTHETKIMLEGFTDAYRNNIITSARIKQSARRIIYRKINLGIMDSYIEQRMKNWSPEDQEKADILLRRSKEIEQNIQNIESQLSKVDSVNNFISKYGIKTISGTPENQSNVLQYNLFTDVLSSDPLFASLKVKALKIYPLMDINEKRCSEKCLLLHTGKTPLEYILQNKKNKPWIIYTVADPFPSNKYSKFITENDLLITTFSDTKTSREMLINTVKENIVPPKASVLYR